MNPMNPNGCVRCSSLVRLKSQHHVMRCARKYEPFVYLNFIVSRAVKRTDLMSNAGYFFVSQSGCSSRLDHHSEIYGWSAGAQVSHVHVWHKGKCQPNDKHFHLISCCVLTFHRSDSKWVWKTGLFLVAIYYVWVFRCRKYNTAISRNLLRTASEICRVIL